VCWWTKENSWGKVDIGIVVREIKRQFEFGIKWHLARGNDVIAWTLSMALESLNEISVLWCVSVVAASAFEEFKGLMWSGSLLIDVRHGGVRCVSHLLLFPPGIVLPLKWMAPETLTIVFSTFSDIWAFAIVILGDLCARCSSLPQNGKS